MMSSAPWPPLQSLAFNLGYLGDLTSWQFFGMVYVGPSWPGVEKSHHVKWPAAVLHVQSPNEQWHEVGVPFSFGQRVFLHLRGAEQN